MGLPGLNQYLARINGVFISGSLLFAIDSSGYTLFALDLILKFVHPIQSLLCRSVWKNPSEYKGLQSNDLLGIFCHFDRSDMHSSVCSCVSLAKRLFCIFALLPNFKQKRLSYLFVCCVILHAC